MLRFLTFGMQHLLHSVGAQDFGLFQDELGRFVLEVGWVAVFLEGAADHDADLGAGGFSAAPRRRFQPPSTRAS